MCEMIDPVGFLARLSICVGIKKTLLSNTRHISDSVIGLTGFIMYVLNVVYHFYDLDLHNVH